MTVEAKKIGFIGAGAMAEALIAGFTGAGLVQGSAIRVFDISGSRVSYIAEKFGVGSAGSGVELVKDVDVIILAVKPFNIKGVLEEVGSAVRPGQLVISIAAGYPLADLEPMIPSGTPVIRVMPNTPCLVGSGMSVLSLGTAAGPQEEEVALSLFRAVGDAVVLPEKLLEAATGLSGSGPAYIYLVIEALIDAGVRVGIPRDIARRLAVQTVAGATKMVRETGLHPGVLKDMVTSPGGTTIVGLEVLEQNCVRASLMEAVVAANERAAELAKK